jgi:hypothetical protein
MKNEKMLFPKNSPLALRPTSIEGVYSFVPPPKGTDLTKASRSTLLKHGVLMRRPDPEKEPKRFALWSKFVTEIWTEENFEEPVFGPPESIPHNMRGGRLTPDGNVVTGNWSGVAVVGQWVGAMGVWTVPTVSKPATPIGGNPAWLSASWVGLDGGGGIIPGTSTTDVLQAGVSQSVAANGTVNYWAWYEWVVANYAAEVNQFPYVLPIPIQSVPVKPGNEISVVVQYVKAKGAEIGNPTPPAGPYSFGGVLLVNVTTNKSVNLYLPPPTGASFKGDSAEWIMECPYGTAGGTLPKFSPIQFNQASACNVLDAPPGGEVGVELQNADTIQFKDKYGSIEAKSSGEPGQVDISYLG